MASAMESIATFTLGGVNSNIIFTSVPQNYKHLFIVVANAGEQGVTNPRDGTMYIGTTAAYEYSWTAMYGNGSGRGAGSSNYNHLYYTHGADLGNTTPYTMATFTIFNYSNGGVYKPILVRADNGNLGTSMTAGVYANVAAVSRITFDVQAATGGNLYTGTTVTLYGIKDS